METTKERIVGFSSALPTPPPAPGWGLEGVADPGPPVSGFVPFLSLCPHQLIWGLTLQQSPPCSGMLRTSLFPANFIIEPLGVFTKQLTVSFPTFSPIVGPSPNSVLPFSLFLDALPTSRGGGKTPLCFSGSHPIDCIQ